jgi:phospholipid transport system transporter-binding protein
MFRPGLTLTVNNAKTVLEAGLQAIRSGESAMDFADVTAVDSAAVAVLLAWQRAARKAGKQLIFANLPDNLLSLAQLYGVADLLPSTSPADPHAHLLHH